MILVSDSDGWYHSSYPEDQRAMAIAANPGMTVSSYSGVFEPPVPVPGQPTPAMKVPVEAVVIASPAMTVVTVVNKVDLFRRTTEDEADQIMAALSQTSNRLQAIFNAAVTYRSDAPEWSILHDTAVGLFGVDRANQLLAPSV